MDRRFIIIAVVIFFFALLGFLAYNNLEIYEGKRFIAPSYEVSSNLYYAMELWLKETGHNVRNENFFSTSRLADTAEKVIIAHSSSIRLRNAAELVQWIENGGCFILCLDIADNVLSDNIIDFLSEFGITAEYAQRVQTLSENPDRESMPVFQTRVSLKTDNEENFYLMKDSRNNIKLAEIKIGSGVLTVTGLPVFMYNYNLTRDVNAELAWKLTGERTGSENMGILFARQQSRAGDTSVLGAIFKRGSLVPVFISAFILITAGFWMVIPVFGLVPREKKSALRPIEDRFTAEARFLQKHHALDYYLGIYRRERKTREDSESAQTYNYKEMIKAIKTEQEKIYGK